MATGNPLPEPPAETSTGAQERRSGLLVDRAIAAMWTAEGQLHSPACAARFAGPDATPNATGGRKDAHHQSDSITSSAWNALAIRSRSEPTLPPDLNKIFGAENEEQEKLHG